MISIIIPTLNEERYVGALLEALAHQTFRDFEVIVVDGDSEDATQAVVEGFRGRLPALEILAEPRRGLARQRNMGGRAARGERLFFMDADGTVEPGFLRHILGEIHCKGLDAGCVLSRPASKRPFDRLYFKLYLDWMIRLCRHISPLATGACIYARRELFERLGGFNEELLFEDSEFSKRAGRIGRFGVLGASRVRASVRRMDTDGRWTTAGRLFFVFFYRIFAGEIPLNDDFYRFGHHQ